MKYLKLTLIVVSVLIGCTYVQSVDARPRANRQTEAEKVGGLYPLTPELRSQISTLIGMARFGLGYKNTAIHTSVTNPATNPSYYNDLLYGAVHAGSAVRVPNRIKEPTLYHINHLRQDLGAEYELLYWSEEARKLGFITSVRMLKESEEYLWASKADQQAMELNLANQYAVSTVPRVTEALEEVRKTARYAEAVERDDKGRIAQLELWTRINALYAILQETRAYQKAPSWKQKAMEELILAKERQGLMSAFLHFRIPMFQIPVDGLSSNEIEELLLEMNQAFPEHHPYVFEVKDGVFQGWLDLTELLLMRSMLYRTRLPWEDNTLSETSDLPVLDQIALGSTLTHQAVHMTAPILQNWAQGVVATTTAADLAAYEGASSAIQFLGDRYREMPLRARTGMLARTLVPRLPILKGLYLENAEWAKIAAAIFTRAQKESTKAAAGFVTTKLKALGGVALRNSALFGLALVIAIDAYQVYRAGQDAGSPQMQAEAFGNLAVHLAEGFGASMLIKALAGAEMVQVTAGMGLAQATGAMLTAALTNPVTWIIVLGIVATEVIQRNWYPDMITIGVVRQYGQAFFADMWRTVADDLIRSKICGRNLVMEQWQKKVCLKKEEGGDWEPRTFSFLDYRVPPQAFMEMNPEQQRENRRLYVLDLDHFEGSVEEILTYPPIDRAEALDTLVKGYAVAYLERMFFTLQFLGDVNVNHFKGLFEEIGLLASSASIVPVDFETHVAKYETKDRLEVRSALQTELEEFVGRAEGLEKEYGRNLVFGSISDDMMRRLTGLTDEAILVLENCFDLEGEDGEMRARKPCIPTPIEEKALEALYEQRDQTERHWLK